MFRASRGNAFRMNVWWKGAHRGCERAQWIGDKMSFYSAHPNGVGPVIIRSGEQMEKDDAGFARKATAFVFIAAGLYLLLKSIFGFTGF